MGVPDLANEMHRSTAMLMRCWRVRNSPFPISGFPTGSNFIAGSPATLWPIGLNCEFDG